MENLDFLVITETWLTNMDEDQQWLKTSELDNSEYRIEVQNRTNKKGGGLALLYRKQYNPTRQLVNTKYDLLEHASWMVELKGKAITILAIYHPPIGPAGNTITRFIDQVSELFQYYLVNHKNLVILGDFNIHVHDRTNPDSLAYINTLEALGLMQHISTPTHRLGGILDLIYTESLAKTKVTYSFTGNYISDHRLVGIELETSKLWEQPTSTRFRKYTDITLENFTATFRNEEITQHSKLEDTLEAYNKEIERTLDLLAPVKKKTDHKKQSRPWYNTSLLDQRKIVRNRERIFNHYRLDHQWKAFTREINRYNTMLNYYKRNHLVGQVKDAQNDSKQLFRIVDRILGRKNENPLPKAASPLELAEDFASYFHTKIDTIREGFKGIDIYKPQPRNVPQLVKFAPVLPSELGKIIHRMPPKTCKLDQIPTNKLQEILDGCLPALLHITNRSLELGEFADGWKEALVKPLIKKKQLGTVNSNYRPVSNLSFISKIVEKTTLEQFNNHCNQHSLLPEYQSAYRRHHSCETSLVRLVNDILWNIEKQLVTPIVILDLSTAFDTVDHDLLLGVLATRFGIQGKALEWYSNYLKPRRFRVTIEEEISKPRQLDYSVPQGSIQGAFLFIAYASTLDQVINTSQLELNGFADDHSVRSSFKPSKLDHTNEHQTIAILEQSMQDIKVWMDQVCLKMNNSKTEFIYFG